jgi:hypothetical protein
MNALMLCAHSERQERAERSNHAQNPHGFCFSRKWQKAVAGTSFESFANRIPPADLGEVHSAVTAYGQFGRPVPQELVRDTPYSDLGGQVSGGFVRQQANGILSAYTKGAKLTPENKQVLAQAGYPTDMPDVYDPKTVNVVLNGDDSYSVLQVGRNSGQVSSKPTGVTAPPRSTSNMTEPQIDC